jgi:hypothetical protein
MTKGQAARLTALHRMQTRSGSAFLYSETGVDKWIGGRG